MKLKDVVKVRTLPLQVSRTGDSWDHPSIPPYGPFLSPGLPIERTLLGVTDEGFFIMSGDDGRPYLASDPLGDWTVNGQAI